MCIVNFRLWTLTPCCQGYRTTLKMSGAGDHPAPGAIPDEGIKEKDPILVEINKKIETAFDIFDHESNKTGDVRYSRSSAANTSWNPKIIRQNLMCFTCKLIFLLQRSGYNHSFPKLLPFRGGASRHDPGSGRGGADRIHQTREVSTNDGKGAHGEKV